MEITEDVGRLLVHCKETGGYMVGDPVPIAPETIDHAEELGLVDVAFDGTAVLTPTGLAWAAWSRYPRKVEQDGPLRRSPGAERRERNARHARRFRRR